ncbi:hypothetical protein [Bergeyella cardium]|uniref:Uncharacterized protein n=1 Tax=Bergeyella cardium TaxID=1585976 RepID=A0A6P1QUN3_9FLAO|nr:hypothetical protein [Bergeyella cardium]QHN64481.1 hypothetical protein DBX24_00535 [Bergeyella cardium]WHE33773.1 hypothetical protein P8603_00535 [Bergeyella cardium]WHF60423.1 hypothetical protein O0R51_00535 [Bergeyella cardium]
MNIIIEIKDREKDFILEFLKRMKIDFKTSEEIEIPQEKMKKEIALAEKQLKQGKVTRLKSKEEINAFFESL